MLALLVLRRWRHLLMWWVAAELGRILTVDLAAIARRPRPFGVDLRSSWGGWALPSLEVAFLTAILMGVLYTLVPEGRWRNLGKWMVTALITLVALGRIALGVDAPTDVLAGWASGSLSRCWPFAASPPTRPTRSPTGGAAAPTWTSAGPAARPSDGRWPTSWGWSWRRSSRSGWPARPAPPPCGSRSRGIRPGSCSASCTPKATCAPTAGTSSAGNCCMDGWRTRSRTTPCAGWSNKRTM